MTKPQPRRFPDPLLQAVYVADLAAEADFAHGADAASGADSRGATDSAATAVRRGRGVVRAGRSRGTP